jgi:hypothetical protein
VYNTDFMSFDIWYLNHLSLVLCGNGNIFRKVRLISEKKSPPNPKYIKEAMLCNNVKI